MNNLCDELSSLLSGEALFNQPPAQRALWQHGPQLVAPELGNPSSSGGQNDARYAYFRTPAARDLSERAHAVYDTLEIRSAAARNSRAVTRVRSPSSQLGTFTVESLPLAWVLAAAIAQSYAQQSTRSCASTPRAGASRQLGRSRTTRS